MRFPTSNLAIAAVYCLLGLSGLALAIPPGYASPIFPAAGFALAAVLVQGRQAGLAVWAGSCALNLLVAYNHGTLAASTVAVSVAIASGAALQAWLGQWLVRRFASPGWTRLEDLRDILRFLLCGGPVACLVSATVGVSALLAGGVIGEGESARSWWHWYVGDTLGVLISAPLVLCILRRDDATAKERQRLLILPVLALLGLVFLAFQRIAKWEQAEEARALADVGGQVTHALQEHIDKLDLMLGSVARHAELSHGLSQREFDHFTDWFLRANREISAISFNAYLTQAERPAFEQRMRAAVGTDRFTIGERQDRQLVRAGDRPEYVVVQSITPLADNQAALGFDINSEPLRQDAIRRARQHRGTALTAPIQLVQEPDGRLSVLALSPAYRSTGPLGAEGADRLLGLAVAVIRIDDLAREAMGALLPAGLIVELTDLQASGQGRPHYRSSRELRAAAGAGGWTSRVTAGDREWRVRVLPSEAYAELHRPWVAWLAGVSGLLFSAVLQVLLLVVTGRTGVVQRQVDAKTAELVDTNQALEQARRTLSQVIDVVPEVVLLVDRDGRIRMANQQLATVLGYQPDELLGEPFDCLVPERFRPRHEALRAAQAQAPRTPVVVRDAFARHKSGRDVAVEVAVAPLHADTPGWTVVAIADITLRLEQTRALRDSEKRFRLMAGGIRDYAVIFLDAEGRISSWNEGAQRIKGYAEPEALGQPFTIFYPPEDIARGLPAQMLQEACERGSVECTGWRLRKGGGRFFADVVTTAIRDDQGQLIGYAKITRDVTERKALEDALQSHREHLEEMVRDRTADLEVAKEAAEAASRAKSTFLSLVSHELRTPMNGILGMVGLARRRAADPKAQDYLVKAERSAHELLAIIDGVLELSQLQSRQLTLASAPFDLDRLVVDASQVHLGAAARKGLALSVDVHRSAQGKHYLGDARRIAQSLSELVANAVKFTEQGRVTVQVLELGGGDGGPVLRFEVQDTGIGIGDDNLARIFDPFEQVDGSSSRRFGGTGLGLTLTRQLAEAMGGRLGVASRLGAGSTFWMEIPALRASTAPHRPASGASLANT